MWLFQTHLPEAHTVGRTVSILSAHFHCTTCSWALWGLLPCFKTKPAPVDSEKREKGKTGGFLSLFWDAASSRLRPIQSVSQPVSLSILTISSALISYHFVSKSSAFLPQMLGLFSAPVSRAWSSPDPPRPLRFPSFTILFCMPQTASPKHKWFPSRMQLNLFSLDFDSTHVWECDHGDWLNGY